MLKMIYTDLDTSTTRTVIARANSADGENWSVINTDDSIPGVVLRGTSNPENIESAGIIKNSNSEYWIYFSGYQDVGVPVKGFPADLYRAESTDGDNFTYTQGTPIHSRTTGWYNNDAIYNPSVYYTGSEYQMVYAGHAFTDFSLIDNPGNSVVTMTSSDGLNWTDGDAISVLKPYEVGNPTWMDAGAAEPYLFVHEGQYILFFTGINDAEGQERNIGMCTSPTFPNHTGWNRRPNPIIERVRPHDLHGCLAPTVRMNGDNIQVWYLGFTENDEFTIGYCEGNINDLGA